MISFDNLKSSNDMCGGMSYHGYAEFEGKTVKDVLEEIKEHLKGGGCYLDAGKEGKWGKLGISFGAAWSIKINGKLYLYTWLGDNKMIYDHSLDDAEVTYLEVDGGWYCDYNYNIHTDKPPYNYGWKRRN